MKSKISIFLILFLFSISIVSSTDKKKIAKPYHCETITEWSWCIWGGIPYPCSSEVTTCSGY